MSNKRRFWEAAFLMTMVLMLLCVGTAYADSKAPTRTEPLDLTNLIAAEDHLSDEGWKWEPTEDGGTLTLRNFYLRCDPTATSNSLVVAKGNIDIVLEGENIVEMETITFRPLLHGVDNANWTVRETKNGGKLELKMPAGTAKNFPYGFAGAKLTIESGSIHSRMVLAFVDNFEMKGGSVLIDEGTGKYAAIQALNGSAVLTGGKVTITGSVCGIAAFNINTPGKIEIDGADVTIDAAVVALSGSPIVYKNGNLDISAGTQATRVPIQTSIPGTGTSAGVANTPYDAAKGNSFTSFKAQHSHKEQTDVWEHDDNEHWHPCLCGIILSTTPHKFTEKYDETKHWLECECGLKKDSAAHTFGEWKETKAPSQAEEGLQVRQCTSCGYEETRTIDMLPTIPKTGDTTPVGVYALLLVLCGMTLLLLRKQTGHAAK